MDGKDPNARFVKGTFQCDMQVTQQRRLVITGHIYDDDTPEMINKALDVAQDALDRQFVRCDILNKRAQIKAQLAGIEQFRDQLADLQAIAEGKGTGLSSTNPNKRPKLSSQQQLAMQNGQATIDKAQKNIAVLEADIAAAEKHIGPVPA